MARFVLEFDTVDYDSDSPDGETIAGQIGYALHSVGGQIRRVGIDANDPRSVLDMNGNTVGQFVLNREQSADTNSRPCIYGCGQSAATGDTMCEGCRSGHDRNPDAILDAPELIDNGE